ncbi:MAG: hypothetical protein LBO63_06275 [Oscillospiraceae bacterium]|nr:hypothetical protein [Oscillospiraceae bacterium]
MQKSRWEAVEAAANGGSLAFSVEVFEGKYNLYIKIDSDSGLLVDYNPATGTLEFGDEKYALVKE